MVINKKNLVCYTSNRIVDYIAVQNSRVCQADQSQITRNFEIGPLPNVNRVLFVISSSYFFLMDFFNFSNRLHLRSGIWKNVKIYLRLFFTKFKTPQNHTINSTNYLLHFFF